MERARTARPQHRAEDRALPELVSEVLSQPGEPLAPKALARLETALGQDFSRVRVHTDRAAVQSARSIGANAYSFGSDIVFAEGRYAPGTPAGDRLLAHELTHVAQQGTVAGSAPSRLGAPLDHAEHEATEAATAFGQPGAKPLSVHTGQPAVVRRDVAQASVDSPTLDQRYRTAVAEARQTGNWQDAAELLNGFSRPDIQDRLAELTLDEIAYLHLGALSNRRIGAGSAVAQLTEPRAGNTRSRTASPSAGAIPVMAGAMTPLLRPSPPQPFPLGEPPTAQYPRVPGETPLSFGAQDVGEAAATEALDTVVVGDTALGAGTVTGATGTVTGGTVIAQGSATAGGVVIAGGAEVSAVTGGTVATGVTLGGMLLVGAVVIGGLVILLAESDPVEAPPAQPPVPATDPGDMPPAVAPPVSRPAPMADPGWHAPMALPSGAPTESALVSSANDDAEIARYVQRLSEYGEGFRTMFGGTESEWLAKLRDPARRAGAIEALDTYEGIQAHMGGQNPAEDYDQLPQEQPPTGAVAFTEEDALKVILARRTPPLNTPEYRELPDSAFTAKKGMEVEASNAKREIRRVVTIYVPGKGKLRFSVAYDTVTQQFEDVHGASGKGKRH